MEFLPLEIDNETVYAGFWKRLGAVLVDLFVFVPLVAVFHFAQGLSIVSAMIVVVVWSLLFSAYTIYFHYRFGATIGKMAVGIKVTFPDGSRIGLKQALLRSSVDLGFAFFFVFAQVLAISKADPDTYLNAGWMERARYIWPLFPAWYGLVDALSQLWFWGEFLVLLFNKRKRALHDFIAGTVVIKQEYAEQVAEPDPVAGAPSLMS